MKKGSQQEKPGEQVYYLASCNAARQLGNRVAAVGHRVLDLPDPEAVKSPTYLGSTRRNCSVYGTVHEIVCVSLMGGQNGGG